MNGHRLIQHDGRWPCVHDEIYPVRKRPPSIIIFMNHGEDDEAAMPTRLTDMWPQSTFPDSAALRFRAPVRRRTLRAPWEPIPIKDKPKAHVAPTGYRRQARRCEQPRGHRQSRLRVDFPAESAFRASGLATSHSTLRMLATISVYREPKTGQLTPWTPTQREYVDEANAHAVRVGFIERELAHKTYRFGNIATGAEQFSRAREQSTGKVLYRGVKHLPALL